MAFHVSDLATALDELRPAVLDGWIQKIHQPQPMALIITIRRVGTTAKLYGSVEPGFARVHLISTNYPNPPVPPPFCQFLRSTLEGGQIRTLDQEQEDRLVYVTISKATQSYILVFAMLGHRGNILLLDSEHHLLRSLRESRFKIGEQFVPPKREALVIPPSSSKMRENALPLSIPRKGTFADQYPYSARWETLYKKKEEEQHQSQLFASRLAQARKTLKSSQARLQSLQEDFAKTQHYQDYGRYGELLKTVLHTLRKGQETATVSNFYDPTAPHLSIPLDPTKDPVQNMETYFRKHRKFLGAQQHLLPRIEKQKHTVAEQLKQLTEIEHGILPTHVPLQPTKMKQASPPPRPAKSSQKSAQGYRSYVSKDGFSIFVGKTAKDNDQLTFKAGKPDDLWLHARGTPGSHVIIQLAKGQTAPYETLRDAAVLALWFSVLRKSGKGEVIYTLRKFVKKTKGQKPGAVQVTRDKSLWVDLQEDRLARLKRTV